MCRFFNEKKSVYLIIESFRIRRQSRKLPKPFSGNHQLQRKGLETSADTHLGTQTTLPNPPTHTHTHTPKDVDTEAAETQTQKKIDSETHTPTTPAYEAVLHC